MVTEGFPIDFFCCIWRLAAIFRSNVAPHLKVSQSRGELTSGRP